MSDGVSQSHLSAIAAAGPGRDRGDTATMADVAHICRMVAHGFQVDLEAGLIRLDPQPERPRARISAASRRIERFSSPWIEMGGGGTRRCNRR